MAEASSQGSSGAASFGTPGTSQAASQVELPASGPRKRLNDQVDKGAEVLSPEQMVKDAEKIAVLFLAAMEETKFKPELREDLEKVMAKINEQLDFTVALVGKTGSGKSSLINALLGDHVVLAVDSEFACTSVATEISSHREDYYLAEVVFYNAADWTAEVEVLVSDIYDGEDPKAAAAASELLRSVYPNFTQNSSRPEPHELARTGVGKHLGSIVSFKADTSASLLEMTAPFVQDQHGGIKKGEEAPSLPQIWPLVSVLRVKVPAAKPKGFDLENLKIVDLAGLDDNNAAREKSTMRYLDNACGILVTTMRKRALANPIVAEFLTGQTGQRLKDKGRLTDSVFVANGSDDFNVVEAAKKDPILSTLFKDELAALKVDLNQRLKAARAVGDTDKANEWRRGVADQVDRMATLIERLTPDVLKSRAETLQAFLHSQFKARITNDNIPLPEVYSVSATESLRIELSREGEPERARFTSMDDTGIPQLRRKIQSLAKETKINSAKQVLKMTRAVLVSTKFVLEGGDINRDGVAVGSKAAIQSGIVAYEQVLAATPGSIRTSFQGLIAGDLLELISDASLTATEDAADVLRQLEALTWNTFKAVAKRNGRWTSPDTKKEHDFNDQFIRGMFSELEAPFDALLISFKDLILNVEKDFSTGYNDFCDGLSGKQPNLRARIDHISTETKKGLKAKFDEVGASIRHRAKVLRQGLYDVYLTALKRVLKAPCGRAEGFVGTGAKKRGIEDFCAAINHEVFLSMENALKRQLKTLVDTIKLKVSGFCTSALTRSSSTSGAFPSLEVRSELTLRLCMTLWEHDESTTPEHEYMLHCATRDLARLDEMLAMLPNLDESGAEAVGEGGNERGNAKKWKGKANEEA